MSCCSSENTCRTTVSVIGWTVLALASIVVITMIPEIKRYIKISSM